jgi:hypothetical protein
METFDKKTMRSLKWTLVGAVAACGVLGALQGCELIVNFDRSKIPSDSGFEDDVVIGDGGEDASDSATPGTDATTGGDASDATTPTSDATPSGDGNVSTDGAADASTTDATPETSTSTPDAEPDAEEEAGEPPPVDAAADVVDTGVAETGTVSEASTPAEAGPVDAAAETSSTPTDAALDAIGD